MLINSAETFIRAVRWRAVNFLNPSKTNNKKENFGFRSAKPAPSVPELKAFEDGMLDLVKNVQFREKTNEFQEKLKKDSLNIKSETKVFAAADKTTNFYKTEPEDYLNLFENNLTKDYKKSDEKTVSDIEKGDIEITRRLDIDDRVFETTKRQAFVTVKDHKDNFRNNPKCRLLNPTKLELGKISKKITERINTVVREKTGFNQWKNTKSTTTWYTNQKQKHKLKFIQADIDGMYSNITEELLDKAIEWAKQYVEISDSDKDIIFQAKKSVIYHKNEPWKKKGVSHFDVTMGSYDGAETCDLIGLYLSPSCRTWG